MPASSINGIATSGLSAVNGLSTVDELNSISFTLSGGGGGTYFDEVMADNPLGYWRLGEPSGTTASDETTNNLDGTYLDSPTLGEPSLLASDPANTSVRFTKTSSDCVRMSASAAFDLTGQFTLECLYNPTTFPAATGVSHYLCGKGLTFPTPLAQAYVLFLRNDSGTVKLIVASYDGAGYEAVWNISGWSTGQTRHIAGGWDGSTMHLYVDGVEVASAATAEGAQLSDETFAIGCQFVNNGGADFTDGTVDEVAVYDTWIGGARITAHYNASL